MKRFEKKTNISTLNWYQIVYHHLKTLMYFRVTCEIPRYGNIIILSGWDDSKHLGKWFWSYHLPVQAYFGDIFSRGKLLIFKYWERNTRIFGRQNWTRRRLHWKSGEVIPSDTPDFIRNLRNRHFVVSDISFFIIAAFLSYAIRFDTFNPNLQIANSRGLIVFLAVAIPIKLSVFYLLGIYRRYWMTAGPSELILVGFSCLIATVIILIVVIFVTRITTYAVLPLPTSIPVIDVLINAIFITGSRFSIRAYSYTRRSRSHRRRIANQLDKVALIIGPDTRASRFAVHWCVSLARFTSRLFSMFRLTFYTKLTRRKGLLIELVWTYRTMCCLVARGLTRWKGVPRSFGGVYPRAGKKKTRICGPKKYILNKFCW